MSEPIRLRPELQWFAEQMELRLRANDYKGGWEASPLAYLNGRLREEMNELDREVFPLSEADPKRVTHEAADVANFAMMIADRARRQGHNNR